MTPAPPADSVRVTRPSARPFSTTSSACWSPDSTSTASRTGSSASTDGNGGSITAEISASSRPGSDAACRAARVRRSPRRHWSCRRGYDRQLRDPVLVQQRDGLTNLVVRLHGDQRRNSPAARLRRSTSPTVRWASRARNPYWRIQLSEKIFDRYERPPSGRITTTIASGSPISAPTWSAACSAIPPDPPARIPSVCASRRVVRNESRSETVTQRSTEAGSNVCGQKSSPTPSTRYGRILASPPE